MKIKIRIKTIRKNCYIFLLAQIIILMGCNPESTVNRPVASFDYSPMENIKITDTIKFSNNSKNSNYYFWDFGDGTTSIIKEPTHVYKNYDSYTVTLITTNEALSDTISKTIILQDNRLKPVASFDYSPKENIRINDEIKFSNNSENSNLYFWDFGDGTTSTLKEPTHVFESYRSFNVTLISTNEGLSDTISNTITLSDVIILNNVSSIDVDNDGINDFSVINYGFSVGHLLIQDLYLESYNDYLIISDSVFVDYWNLSIKETKTMYTPKKFSLGDTIKSSHIFTLKSAYFSSFYSQWMVSSHNMNYWISQDTKYVGFLKIVGNKPKIGWIKINVPDFNTVELISYKIPTAGDRLIIDK